MKKRFCDVCERGIRGVNSIIETNGLHIGVYAYRSGSEARDDICQSCIIEAIGKLYVALRGEKINEEIEANIRRLA